MEAFIVGRTSSDGVQTTMEVQPPGVDQSSFTCEELDLSVVSCIRELDVYWSESQAHVVAVRVIDSLGQFHSVGVADVTNEDLIEGVAEFGA